MQSTPVERQPLVNDQNPEGIAVIWPPSYQEGRKVRYKGGKACPTTVFVLYCINVGYVILLEAFAFAELAQISPSQISNVIQNQSNAELISNLFSIHAWAAMIGLALTFAAAWWLYTIIVACMNAEDEAHNASELRNPPALLSVGWVTFQLLSWMLVMASTVTIYQFQGNFSNVTQSGARIIQMLLVIFVGIFTTYPPLLKLLRISCGACLGACKSPCRDC